MMTIIVYHITYTKHVTMIMRLWEFYLLEITILAELLEREVFKLGDKLQVVLDFAKGAVF